MPGPRPLLIGVGNPQRGDDGAGIALARGQRLPGLDVVESSGAADRLLSLFEGRSEVTIVDAARSGAPAGTIRRFRAHEAPLPAAWSRASTHGFGLAEGIELARALACLPAICVVYAVEGRSFEPGEGLSAEVEAALETLADAIRQDARRRTIV